MKNNLLTVSTIVLGLLALPIMAAAPHGGGGGGHPGGHIGGGGHPGGHVGGGGHGGGGHGYHHDRDGGEFIPFIEDEGADIVDDCSQACYNQYGYYNQDCIDNC